MNITHESEKTKTSHRNHKHAFTYDKENLLTLTFASNKVYCTLDLVSHEM